MGHCASIVSIPHELQSSAEPPAQGTCLLDASVPVPMMAWVLSASLCAPRRFVLGSNKMMGVGLGKSEADELRTNLSCISKRLKGHVGLLFTKLPREEVVQVRRYALCSQAGSGRVPSRSVSPGWEGGRMCVMRACYGGYEFHSACACGRARGRKGARGAAY